MTPFPSTGELVWQTPPSLSTRVGGAVYRVRHNGMIVFSVELWRLIDRQTIYCQAVWGFSAAKLHCFDMAHALHLEQIGRAA